MEDDGGIDVEDCDDDIYGDLESDIFVSHVKKSKQDELVREERYQKIVKENQELKLKLKSLAKENKTYSTNISALYLTAKSEIDKKNFIIKNLTTKLKAITRSKSAISNADAEEVLQRCQEALVESQAEVTLDEIKRSIKAANLSSAGKRKHIKFGNMSLYFFREESAFQRQESVVFEKPSSKVTSTTSEENSELITTTTQAARDESLPSQHQQTELNEPEDKQSGRLTGNNPVVHLRNLPKSTAKSTFTGASHVESRIPETATNKNLERGHSPSSERNSESGDKTRESTDKESDGKSSTHKPEKIGSYRRSRDYSPSFDRHRRYQKEEIPHNGSYRGKDNDHKRDWDTRRNTNYHTRSSKRIATDSRYSSHNKRPRSRSR